MPSSTLDISDLFKSSKMKESSLELLKYQETDSGVAIQSMLIILSGCFQNSSIFLYFSAFVKNMKSGLIV